MHNSNVALIDVRVYVMFTVDPDLTARVHDKVIQAKTTVDALTAVLANIHAEHGDDVHVIRSFTVPAPKSVLH